MQKNLIQIGMRLEGNVSQIRDYGVMLDRSDGSGLLHRNKMRGGTLRGKNRRLRQLALGSHLEVEVVDIKPGPKNSQHLELSELWYDEIIIEQLAAGTELLGTVVDVLECGLIVSIDAGLAQGYDGFVHISELKEAEQKQREARLRGSKLGDKLSLAVRQVGRNDRGELNIRLSESLVLMRAKLATTFKVGTVHTGDVVRRVREGFLVSFGDFTALLPDRELGKTGAGSIRVGGRVKSKVHAIGNDFSITLSRRGL